MNYREFLCQAEKQLTEVGIIEAKNDAWLLFSEVFNLDRMSYLMKMNEEFSETEQENLIQYHRLLDERKKRIPLQQILHCAYFMGFEFYVNENVLIPRQDTEILVEQALLEIKNNSQERLLDMCTGSGCIAISLALLKHVRVTAVDLSKKALTVAKKNAENLGCEEQIDFLQGDLFEKVTGKFDFILSNPPYIPSEEILTLEPEVRKHEPLLALDGDLDGLTFYRRLALESGKFLNAGGFLFLEIGCEQAEDVTAFLKENGFIQIQIIKDLAGLDRVIKAKKGNN